MQFSWRSPAIRGLQSDCRYVNNNEQITCRSHARALGANDGGGASFGRAGGTGPAAPVLAGPIF